jgi:hypothetical protein
VGINAYNQVKCVVIKALITLTPVPAAPIAAITDVVAAIPAK